MTQPKPELCPNCLKYGLRPYIDPNIGGYVRCSLCNYVRVEGGEDGEL